ncbi:hypothetical protein QYE76_048567 [Lolium multiflorum]|uniref:RING-type E3 ubiquitin transferase n=1 Tax=Lolium multiflorum TaxID=4521 RepID=A0AAD8SND3_LOLMU|nr:hypothetical protein QYE76_048567 [Lolium multiflorum]
MRQMQGAAKKASVDAIYRQGRPDVLRLGTASRGEKGGSSPSRGRGVSIVEVDINWFSCPICFRLLSPPVFQCKRGHLACGGCRAGNCRKCKGGGKRFLARNMVVEDIISVSKFKCPHIGCHEFFSYPDLLAHRDGCHLAPCFCAEPGCNFEAPPPRLFIHLDVEHSWPAYRFTYGKDNWITWPLSKQRRLLLAVEDDCVFVLVVGALGAVTAVSVVCVRKVGGSSQPRYTAVLGASGPPLPGGAAGRTITSPMETVTSSDRPGEVAVDKLPCVLAVPSTYLMAGVDGASKEVSLMIQIKKIP